MTALRLVQQGIPVTLLESGVSLPSGRLVRVMGKTVFRRLAHGIQNGSGHISTGDPQALWYFNLSPGGLSNQWNGAVPRFAPSDFDEGTRLHEKYRWPITYDDLLPYYKVVERLLNVTGSPFDVPQLPACIPSYPRKLPKDWQRIEPCVRACGHGLTTVPMAVGAPWMSARRGTAFNSFTKIIGALLNQSNFDLILGGHGLKLDWANALKSRVGIVYRDRLTGSQHFLEGAAVVLAAGALASTKLLLNSACGSSEDLWNAEGVLGHYLHDHPTEWWVVDFDTPLSLLGHPAYFSRAPYQVSDPLMAAQCVIGHASRQDKIRSIFPSKSTAFGVKVVGTMVPSGSSKVSLHRSDNDDFGMPKLEIDIRYDTAAIENMKQARERFLGVFGQAGYQGAIRPTQSHLRPGVSVHYGGTIRMHASPQYGMLDAWNRLHAVPNVLVTDTSCFTTGVEKNPTATVMAIAARAADRLADDLKRR